jgi:hypothetical protein
LQATPLTGGVLELNAALETTFAAADIPTVDVAAALGSIECDHPTGHGLPR